MKQKEYLLSKFVTAHKLEVNGFRNVSGSTWKKKYTLYPNYVYLYLSINLSEKRFLFSVEDKDGIYSPFYVEDYNSHNHVAHTVIKKYNKYMDLLVSKKILRKKKENRYMEEKIKIKYHSSDIEKLRYIDGKSDWIDLRASEKVQMKKGDFRYIDLGISVELPKGYEMIVAPRSSTFKNFGIIQTNSIGIIDETYCGNDDVIKMPALAMRDTVINVNDRICQFRIQKHQPSIEFVEVNHLEGETRGGFGSTGKN